MKTCPNCGRRIYREQPSGSEYGIAVVDGAAYPSQCPNCGGDVE